jgi:hypothetical protein
MERHPKTTTCDFMHVTVARDDGKVVDEEMDDQ